jgi:rsbT co-antagonist protein RsbR
MVMTGDSLHAGASIDSSAPVQSTALLEQQVEQLQSEVRTLRARLHIYAQTLDAVNDMVIIKDHESRLQYGNRAFREAWGMTEEQLHALIAAPFTPPDTTQHYVRDDLQVLRTGQPLEIEREPLLRYDGVELTVRTCKVPLFDEQHEVCGLAGVITDITTQLNAEAAMRHAIEQEAVVSAQAMALAELSTPLIPVSDAVVAMPLIGALDSRRIQRALEMLLAGVMERRARVAIVDITGVPVVDTQVANALLRAAQAVRLLGAMVVLTGIRPEVAQTLVGLGVSFDSIVTRSSLQSGIVYAFQLTREGAYSTQGQKDAR